jgi:hypothetical protein
MGVGRHRGEGPRHRADRGATAAGVIHPERKLTSVSAGQRLVELQKGCALGSGNLVDPDPVMVGSRSP